MDYGQYHSHYGQNCLMEIHFLSWIMECRIGRKEYKAGDKRGKEVGSTLLFVTTVFSLMSLLIYSAAQSELCSDLFLWDRMGI